MGQFGFCGIDPGGERELYRLPRYHLATYKVEFVNNGFATCGKVGNGDACVSDFNTFQSKAGQGQTRAEPWLGPGLKVWWWWPGCC